MRIETRKATYTAINSFGQSQTQDLGFDKTYYFMSEAEFEGAELPDGNYSMRATKGTRKLVEFQPWEDAEDCKYIAFDVVNGEKVNFKDVIVDVYKTSINYIVFE